MARFLLAIPAGCTVQLESYGLILDIKSLMDGRTHHIFSDSLIFNKNAPVSSSRFDSSSCWVNITGEA